MENAKCSYIGRLSRERVGVEREQVLRVSSVDREQVLKVISVDRE